MRKTQATKSKRRSKADNVSSSDDDGTSGEGDKLAIRRANNREAARRVRERRVHAIKTLSEQVEELVAENTELRELIKALESKQPSSLPDTAVRVSLEPTDGQTKGLSEPESRSMQDTGVQTDPQPAEAAPAAAPSAATLQQLWNPLLQALSVHMQQQISGQGPSLLGQPSQGSAAAVQQGPAGNMLTMQQMQQLLLQMQMQMLQLQNPGVDAGSMVSNPGTPVGFGSADVAAAQLGLQQQQQQQQGSWGYINSITTGQSSKAAAAAAIAASQQLHMHMQQQKQQQQQQEQQCMEAFAEQLNASKATAKEYYDKAQADLQQQAALYHIAHQQQHHQHHTHQTQPQQQLALQQQQQQQHGQLRFQQQQAQQLPHLQQQQQQLQRQQQQATAGSDPAPAGEEAAAAAAAGAAGDDEHRFKPIPDVLCQLDDDAMLMSTDMNLHLNTADMNVTTSDFNAMLLASEELLRHVPTPEEATASRSTAWL